MEALPIWGRNMAESMTHSPDGLEKAELRRTMKALRRAISEEDRARFDTVILDKLLALPQIVSEDRTPVYTYVSYGTEVDTHALLNVLWQRKIPVAVPRVEGQDMAFYQVFGWQDLSPGCMRILEPGPDCLPAEGPSFRRAAVITPGLAFTEAGGRIGYGGGFYDRFFEREPEHLRIAVAYPFQVLARLPMEPCDIKIQKLITGG
ncbi:MAG: 5-formyltetrahydrofolate cyclo-ligase [Lachnospiraceae bacterium]|nr:5-formyltetrahydrofolate cyclo-ligase [Lachnospiraceae bacterium]